jgi:hypothetical protein
MVTIKKLEMKKVAIATFLAVRTVLIAETLAIIASSFFLLPSSFFLRLYRTHLGSMRSLPAPQLQ